MVDQYLSGKEKLLGFFVGQSMKKSKGKANPKILNDILKNRVQLSLSMQSLKTETLKEIKRTNWTIDQYLGFINEVKKRGKPTASEMIIPLPNETEESFYQGVKFFMDNHVQTRTWTLMQLVGTELGRDFAIKKYN